MTIEEQIKIFKEGTVDLISESELITKLKLGKPLKIKTGFDPTAPDIHMGHTVLLNKLKRLQELGHEVIILIGDFTAQIGDPTGKSKLRKKISMDEVSINAKTYQDQVFKILDKEKTTVVYNSNWLNPISFNDVLNLASKYTLARLLEREDFNNRYKSNKPISIMELFYPLIQGYDSVELESDIEIGGTDQKFNLLVGRELMREYEKTPQVVITLPLLEGLDGVQKMSKSLNNYIGLTDTPKDMLGKVMSIPDELILKYFNLITNVDKQNINKYKIAMESGENPRNYKVLLGKALIEMYHTKDLANKAEEEFDNIFKKGGLPDTVPLLEIDKTQMWIVDLISLSNQFQSNSDIRRVIKQGGVSLNEIKITNEKETVNLEAGMILKIGKRDFYQIKIK